MDCIFSAFYVVIFFQSVNANDQVNYLDNRNDFNFLINDINSNYKQINQIEKSDESMQDLYQTWNNLNMCANVKCKPTHTCTVVDNSNVECKLDIGKVINLLKHDADKEWNFKYEEIKKISNFQSNSICDNCDSDNEKSFYCASNNQTFASLCKLQYFNCVNSAQIVPFCKGNCPCSFLTKPAQNNLKQSSQPMCTKNKLHEIGLRLFDWFFVISKNLFSDKKNEIKSLNGENFSKNKCTKNVINAFQFFDSDLDNRLNFQELKLIKRDQHEKCIFEFIDSCDVNKNKFITLLEWCECFKRYRPCTNEKNLIRTNFCDEDGYFLPKQCNKITGQCWCVDKLGAITSTSKVSSNFNCVNTIKNTRYKDEDAEIGDDDIVDYLFDEEGSG